MKGHHIVCILAVIGAMVLAVDKVLSANIIDAVAIFALLSVPALSTLFKDKLPSQLYQRRLPTSWVLVVIAGILLFCTVILDYFR